MARRDGQIGVMMDKKKTLYMIGNAHLDIVWPVSYTHLTYLDRMGEAVTLSLEEDFKWDE